MNYQDLIGYELKNGLEIIKNSTKKEIIVKDNSSFVNNHNITSIVRIKEFDNYIEIISSNFKYLN